MSEAAAAAAAKSWINGDESARQMLARAQASRPSLSLPPPLHRIPLHAGNVVEIAGRGREAKTQLLIQVNGLDVAGPSRQGIVEILKKNCILFLNMNPAWHFFDKLRQ